MTGYRGFYQEIGENHFISGSVELNTVCWGFGALPTLDFEFVDAKLTVHIGPFTLHLAAGRADW